MDEEFAVLLVDLVLGDDGDDALCRLVVLEEDIV